MELFYIDKYPFFLYSVIVTELMLLKKTPIPETLGNDICFAILSRLAPLESKAQSISKRFLFMYFKEIKDRCYFRYSP